MTLFLPAAAPFEFAASLRDVSRTYTDQLLAHLLDRLDRPRGGAPACPMIGA